MRRSNFRGVRDGAEVANLNVQTFVDCRLVASIGKFLLEHGQIAQTQYGRISTYCMRYFMDVLEANYPEELVRFENTSDAIQWLGANGFSLAQFKAGSNNRLINTVRNEHAVQDDLNGFFQPIVPPRPIQQAADTSLSFLGDDKDDMLRELSDALQRGEKTARVNDPAYIAHITAIREDMRKNIDGLMAKQEAESAPLPKEVIEANLRASAIRWLISNNTGQPTPCPEAIAHLVVDPSVILEAQPKIQEWIDTRELNLERQRQERQKEQEERARRQSGE